MHHCWKLILLAHRKGLYKGRRNRDISLNGRKLRITGEKAEDVIIDAEGKGRIFLFGDTKCYLCVLSVDRN